MALGFGSTKGVGSTDLIQTTFTAQVSARSYAAWFNENGLGGGSFGRIFHKALATPGNDGIYFYTNDDGTTMVLDRGFSVLAAEWTITKPSTGTWHHAVITYDDSLTTNNPIIYIDGSSVTVTIGTIPIGTADAADGAFCIGNRLSDSARNWDGSLAELAIWDRILDAAEAKALGNGFSPGFFPISRVFYEPMIRHNVNLVIAPSTITGTAVQPHPRVIYPASFTYVKRKAGPSIAQTVPAFADTGGFVGSRWI